MRTAIPTDLLLRLMNATPEQYAAVERALGMTERREAVETEPASDDVARQLFALLKALELETHYRKAPITRVFRLFCLESLTRNQVAKACRCSPSLIKLRLREIERKLGRKPTQLRAFSSEFERMTDALSDSRARRINRERAIYGEDPEDDE